MCNWYWREDDTNRLFVETTLLRSGLRFGVDWCGRPATERQPLNWDVCEAQMILHWPRRKDDLISVDCVLGRPRQTRWRRSRRRPRSEVGNWVPECPKQSAEHWCARGVELSKEGASLRMRTIWLAPKWVDWVGFWIECRGLGGRINVFSNNDLLATDCSSLNE